MKFKRLSYEFYQNVILLAFILFVFTSLFSVLFGTVETSGIMFTLVLIVIVFSGLTVMSGAIPFVGLVIQYVIVSNVTNLVANHYSIDAPITFGIITYGYFVVACLLCFNTTSYVIENYIVETE